MKIKIILIAPVWKNVKNDPTLITYGWATKLKKYLHELSKHNGYQLECFIKKDAVRKQVEDYLLRDKGNPGIIIFLDHGQEDSLLGSDKLPMIDLDNAYLLQNKFIYSIACRSGSSLAKKAISKGACGYIGFVNDFQFIIKSDLIGKCTDTFGKCFLSGLTKLLADQCNMWDAVEHIQSRTEGIMADIRNKLAKKGEDRFKEKYYLAAAYIITSLRHNLDCMSPLGDPKWSIKQWASD